MNDIHLVGNPTPTTFVTSAVPLAGIGNSTAEGNSNFGQPRLPGV